MTQPVEVSIVVCTYNRADLLRETLSSLAALETAASYEVVVIDNASTDTTPLVIEQAIAASPVPMRGVREGRPGVACARNRGIHESRGQWISFFDDDQVADAALLEELLAMARQKQARVIGGAILLQLPEGCPADFARECRAMLGESAHQQAGRFTPRSAPGTGNLMLHRSVFERVGVFDESLREAGEDTDLFRRIFNAGIEAWFTPRAIGYHVIPPYRLTDEYLRWRCQREGGNLARRDWRDRGRLMRLILLAARLGQGGVVLCPRWLLARMRSRERARGVNCRLWRCQGYVRFALNYLAPRLFAQREFFARLDFRGEREAFSGSCPDTARSASEADVSVAQPSAQESSRAS